MSDEEMTIQTLKNKVKAFMQERDWDQFHSPKNLSMNIAVEASELQEIFLWTTTEGSYNLAKEKLEAVKHEIADVAISILTFCNRCDIDLTTAIKDKMAHNKEKYPIEKSKGIARKYTELD